MTYIADQVKSRYNSTVDFYRKVRQNYSDNVYTNEYVKTKLLEACGQRVSMLKGRAYDASGFQPKERTVHIVMSC